MKRARMARPSPAMAVALVALFASITGIAVSKGKNQIPGGKVPPNSVGPKQLKEGAVTAPDVAVGAIKEQALAQAAVNAAALKQDAVTGDKIKQGAVGSTQLSNQSVGSEKIAKLPGASAEEINIVSVGGSGVQLTYDNEMFDFTGNMYNNATDPAKMVAPRDGVYQVTVSVMWEAEAGTRTLSLVEEQASPVCNCEFDADTRPASASAPTSQSLTSTVVLDAGDKVWAAADSTGDDGSTDIISSRRARLTMLWIGPSQ